MKAWLIDSFTGIDQLRLAETPDPAPAPGEVVLEMKFAALNPADRYLAEGQYPAQPPLPHILGRDGVGTAVALPGQANLQASQHYLILPRDIGVTRAGTFAQRVAVPVKYLVPLPADWTAQQAAAASLVYLTAYQALTQWGELPPSVVLVTGASGGVGVASVQLAKAMGHTVLALSRDPAKRDKLKELGASATFDPSDDHWRKNAKALLAPRRVDLLIDSVGGVMLPQAIETLADRGKISLIGRLAGPVPQFNTATMFFRRLRMGGVSVGAFTPPESRQAWMEILRLLQRSGARPLIDSVFPFADLPRAFDQLKKGPMGKVLLEVNPA